MIAAMIATTVLILACILVHYETLRITSDHFLPVLKMPPRPKILIVVAMAFLAHTIEVWIFAFAYYLLGNHVAIGSVAGIEPDDFPQLLYFSTETYTSLGFGDVYPLGGFQLIAGVEALLGLLMIGWSASFTFI
jgi:Ion channel